MLCGASDCDASLIEAQAAINRVNNRVSLWGFTAHVACRRAPSNPSSYMGLAVFSLFLAVSQLSALKCAARLLACFGCDHWCLMNEEQTCCDVRRKDFGAEIHHAGDNEGNPLGHQDSGEPDHNAAEDHRAQGSLPPR